MNLLESVKNLGLNEKEAKIYLSLLQLGKATANSVAIRSGQKRPTTYVILGQLVEKGFARRVPRSKKQQFIAESPDVCLTLAAERLRFTKEALPELLAMQKGKAEKVSVAYFEGVRGAEEMYKNMFRTMKEKPQEQRNLVAFYAKADKASAELNQSFERMNNECHQLKIKRRAVTVFHPTIINNYLRKEFLEKYFMDIKALAEEKYSSDISIEVYDNYIQILSHQQLQAILIEDLDIAKALKQIFEMVWNLVEKDRENYLRFSSLDSEKANIAADNAAKAVKNTEESQMVDGSESGSDRG